MIMERELNPEDESFYDDLRDTIEDVAWEMMEKYYGSDHSDGDDGNCSSWTD